MDNIKKGFIFNEEMMKIFDSEDNDVQFSVSREIELIISNIISEDISMVLCKSHNDQRNFTSLVSNLIKEQVSQLIKEHENYCLNVAVDHLLDELELDSKVDYSNSLHAKLHSITDELKGRKDL